jgi:hypothetical protein
METIILTEHPNHPNQVYISECGYSMRREKGKTPNGNELNNRWVLRHNGNFIDFDQYRNDLAERHNMKTQRA